MAEYAQRMESFPFDSSPDVEYDEEGYPIYDRAVGAEAMRRTFEKFFSDGVFPNPAEEMQVSAGDSGLTVKVAPGTCIIKGSMGTLLDEVTLTLDTAVQGNTVYGVMAAFDNNEDRRSVYLRVAKGTPGTNEPPEPDRTTPNIYEYRIADVTLNTGATSVSAANVKNNKGTDVWPYAAPFEEIDIDAVVRDAKSAAQEAYESFIEYLDDNMEFIKNAIDGTTAGNLQNQIDEIKEQISKYGIDLSEEVDDETIEYATEGGIAEEKKLRVKAGGIEKDNLAKWLRIEIGIEDTESWTYDDFKAALQEAEGDADKQNDLMGYLDATIVTSWTAAQITEFASLLLDSVQPKFVGYITKEKLKSMSASEVYALSEELSQSARDSMADKIDMLSYGWGDMHLIHQAIGDKNASKYVGKSKNVSVSGTNYPAILIGVAHDTATDSNGSTLTFQFKNSLDVEGYKLIKNATTASSGYPATVMRINYFDKVIDLFPQALKNAIREVTKPCQYFNDSNTVAKKTTFTGKVWPMSISELVNTASSHKLVGAVSMSMFNAANGDGELYEYYAQHVWTSGKLFSFPTGSEKPYTVFRSGANNSRNDYCLAVMVNSSSGSTAEISSYTPSQAAGICPCFCI